MLEKPLTLIKKEEKIAEEKIDAAKDRIQQEIQDYKKEIDRLWSDFREELSIKKEEISQEELATAVDTAVEAELESKE